MGSTITFTSMPRTHQVKKINIYGAVIIKFKANTNANIIHKNTPLLTLHNLIYIIIKDTFILLHFKKKDNSN